MAFIKLYAANVDAVLQTIDYTLTIRRDTTDLHTRDGNFLLTDAGQYEWHNVALGIINAPGAGSYTWKLRVGAKKSDTGGVNVRSWNMYLQVVELKR